MLITTLWLGNDNYDTVKQWTGESYEQSKKLKKLKIWIPEKFWEFFSEKGAKPWIIKAWLMNCSTTLSYYKSHVYTVLLVLKLGWCKSIMFENFAIVLTN